MSVGTTTVTETLSLLSYVPVDRESRCSYKVNYYLSNKSVPLSSDQTFIRV